MNPRERTPDLRPRAAAMGLLLAVATLFLGCASDTSLYPEPKPSPPPAATGSIEGFVYDQDANPIAPIVGAKVYTMPNTAPGILSNGAGFYRLTGLLPGNYFVVSIAPGGRSVLNLTSVTGNRVTTVDMIYGNGALSDRLQLGLLTRAFTPGLSSFATIGPKGAFFQNQPLPQLGGNLRSVRFSRANTDEIILISDFESPAGEIYLCNLRQGTTRRLTNNSVQEDSADLSPDGQRLVYAIDSDSNGRYEIVTQRLDGTRQVTLVPDVDPGTTRLRDSRDPVWAPDGASIAFATRRRDPAASPFESSYNIALLPVDAVADVASARFDQVVPDGPIRLKQLDIFDDRNPAWDNEAANIYFDKLEGGHHQLYTVAATENGAEVRLTNDLFENSHPSISFDGNFIAWISTNTLGGRNPDQGPEVFIGQFLPHLDRVGGITNIRQLTETAANAQNDWVSFRPLFPGRQRINDGTLVR